jgi:cytochrome c-type biogenesis protein CcmH
VTAFLVVAAAMLLAALGLILVPLLRPRRDAAANAAVSSPATVTSVVVALVVPIAAVALYAGVTSYPWRGAPATPAGAHDAPASIDAAIASLEARLSTHPDDATGWRMLGRSRVMTGQYAQAVTAYDEAIELTGGLDPGLRLDLAEALVLTNDAAVQTRAKAIVDEALASDPANQKALWYSGVIALRSEDAATARERFKALLALEPPGEIRGILETQLAALEGVAPASDANAAARETPPPHGRTIRVAVTVDPALTSRIRMGVPVFVSARPPGMPGPPLAAVRLTSDALPTTVELSDANAMIEGRSLSSVDEVEVTARIAFGGTAATAPGDLVGSARSRRAAEERISITIDREVPGG